MDLKHYLDDLAVGQLITEIKKVLEGKVDKVSGKGLSTNDLTSTLKSNYDTAYTHSQYNHAPSNAQENIIETVKVNGATITPSSKTVDVTVPTKTSQLINDSGFKNTDSVLEYTSSLYFPTTGKKNIIYIDKQNNKTYRWDDDNVKYYIVGSNYMEINLIDANF